MALPSGLRAAGDALNKAGIKVNTAPQQFVQNSRPVDPFDEVDALGRNSDIITGNPLFGGLGQPNNIEFQSAADARDRLNDLREIGVYK